MTGPSLRYSRPGLDPVVISFPATADPFAIIERCRQEMFPGVAVQRNEPVKPGPKRRKR